MRFFVCLFVVVFLENLLKRAVLKPFALDRARARIPNSVGKFCKLGLFSAAQLFYDPAEKI